MNDEGETIAVISADTSREAALPFQCESCGAVIRTACDCASRARVRGPSQYGEWHEDLWTRARP